MPATEQLAPNVSREESIQAFRLSPHKDDRRSNSCSFIPKNPQEFQSSRGLLTILLLAQYYSPNTTRCRKMGGPLLNPLYGFRQRPGIERRWLASISLRCSLFRKPVTASFNGNLAEGFCSSALQSEIICFTRSCNGRLGYRRRRRLICTEDNAW
jgi:hypothetical protein